MEEFQMDSPTTRELKAMGDGEERDGGAPGGKKTKRFRMKMPQTPKEALLHFCEHTSMRGMKRALHAPNILWRLTWLLAVTCGLSVAAFHVIQLVRHFFTYPRAIGEDIISQEVPFPAVTLCNLQPISSATTQGQTVYTNKIDNYYHNLEKILVKLKDKSSDHNKELKALKAPFGYYQNAEPATIQETGHPEKILVPYCNWVTSDPHTKKTTPCDNVTLLLDPHFFNCYTHGVSDAFEMNIHPGHWGKLTLIVYLDDFLNTRMETHQEFHPDSTTANSQGARLIIHVPGTLPQPSQEGINVSPGLSLSVNVKAQEYLRLGQPYSNCSVAQTIDVPKRSGGFYKYSAKSCADTCLQTNIYRECECVDAHLPIPTPYHQNESAIQYCGVLNKTTRSRKIADRLKCARNTYKQSKSCNVECGASCHEYQYQVTTSQAKWPHEASHISLYDTLIQGQSFESKFAKYKEDIKPMMSLAKSGNESLIAYEELKKIDLIHRNFLQINIYMDNSELKRIKETEVFEPINLMANVGGMLNLWIGITFITIFELAECLYHLFRTLGRAQPKNTPEERYPSPHNGGLRKEIFPDIAAKQGLNQPEPANV